MAELILEIRTYRLRPGSTESFHRIVSEESMPLVEQAGINVVRFGPSERNEPGVEEYVLIRSFRSLEERDEQETRFYGSREWHEGPRERILDLIESYHTVVLTVADSVAVALHEPN